MFPGMALPDKGSVPPRPAPPNAADDEGKSSSRTIGNAAEGNETAVERHVGECASNAVGFSLLFPGVGFPSVGSVPPPPPPAPFNAADDDTKSRHGTIGSADAGSESDGADSDALGALKNVENESFRCSAVLD